MFRTPGTPAAFAFASKSSYLDEYLQAHGFHVCKRLLGYGLFSFGGHIFAVNLAHGIKMFCYLLGCVVFHSPSSSRFA
jgi:hypothetical protein